MGTSHKSWWTGRVRHGVGQYFMGTGPIYMLASAIFRMAHPPILVGGTANLWGYFKSALQRKPRYGDKAFRKFLRSYQWSCLLHGKRKATENAERQAGTGVEPADGCCYVSQHRRLNNVTNLFRNPHFQPKKRGFSKLMLRYVTFFNFLSYYCVFISVVLERLYMAIAKRRAISP
jgi:hypothetical protein